MRARDLVAFGVERPRYRPPLHGAGGRTHRSNAKASPSSTRPSRSMRSSTTARSSRRASARSAATGTLVRSVRREERLPDARARAARERKQKIFVVVGGLLLLAMLAFQLPKLLGGSSSSEAAAPAAERRRGSDDPGARPWCGSQLASTRRLGFRGRHAGKLTSFSVFSAKDPFVQQVVTDYGLGRGRGGARRRRKDAKTDHRRRSSPTGSPRAPRDDRHRERRASGARTGMTFPAADPLFVLVAEKPGCEVCGGRDRRRRLFQWSEDDDAQGRQAAHFGQYDDGRSLSDLARLRRQRRSAREAAVSHDAQASRRAGLCADRDAYRDRCHQRRPACDSPGAQLRNDHASAVGGIFHGLRRRRSADRAFPGPRVRFDLPRHDVSGSHGFDVPDRQRVFRFPGEPGVQPTRRRVHSLADRHRPRQPLVSCGHVHRLDDADWRRAREAGDRRRTQTRVATGRSRGLSRPPARTSSAASSAREPADTRTVWLRLRIAPSTRSEPSRPVRSPRPTWSSARELLRQKGLRPVALSEVGAAGRRRRSARSASRRVRCRSSRASSRR